MRRLAIACLLPILLLAGCGVMDELDSSNKEMDKQLANKAKQDAIRKGEDPSAVGTDAGDAAGAKPGAKKGKPDPGLLARAQLWWKEAREEKPIPPDPKDRIVKCLHGKQVSFVLKSDCIHSNGEIGEDLGKPTY